MSIIIIGYYGHNNLGDEQYKLTFKLLFNKISIPIKFIDCDTINDHTFNDSDIIIIGGDNLLGTYFIDKLYDKFKNHPNKVVAISVEIPYRDDVLFKSNKLNFIDEFQLQKEQLEICM